MKFSKVRITDHRPPGAGAPSPLGSHPAQPMAAASPPVTVHDKMLDGMSDSAIAGVIADAEKRNLRNYRDHETRWWAERSAAARAIRRERQNAGTWTIAKPLRGKVA